MKSIYLAALVLTLSAAAFAQEFEVATIKPSAPGFQPRSIANVQIDGSIARYSGLTLKLYIATAYKLKFYQISAPDWMASERWDITAKVPDGSNPEQIPQMLQSLLQDRFQMKTHRETKELSIYALILGKGELNLKHSAPDDASSGGSPQTSINAAIVGRGATVSYGNGAYFTFGDNRFEGKKLSMAVIADSLARFADRPVVDMTDLKGDFDFTMEFSPEDFQAMGIRAAIASGVPLPPQALKMLDESSGDTLFRAVEKLGLKLEPRKAPIEMLVIDDALKTPTEN